MFDCNTSFYIDRELRPAAKYFFYWGSYIIDFVGIIEFNEV